MKKFILRLILFFIVGYAVGEVIVRTKKLTSDIPQRYLDASGIQLYVPGQKGFYKGAKEPWKVNEYGWVGISDIENKEKHISIIGDSYIENMLNPISCNQASYLMQDHKNIGFFEAGRSGITFIESMEIAKSMDSLNFDHHLIYLSEDDFYESFAYINRYPDRMQIDLETNTILKGRLKAPGLKKILYNSKFLYYLYTRFPLFVSGQNKGEVVKTDHFDLASFEKLYKYCQNNYDLSKISFVFHPNSSQNILDFFETHEINYVLLKEDTDQTWAINSADGHWSCYGHKEVAKQVSAYLNSMGK